MSLNEQTTDRGEVLEEYTCQGESKKVAKEKAAKLMAESGHCVSNLPGTFKTAMINECNLVSHVPEVYQRSPPGVTEE